MTMRLVGVSGFVLGVVTTVHAHPGHGTDGGSYSIGHLLAEPLHAATGTVLLLMWLALYSWSVRRAIVRTESYEVK